MTPQELLKHHVTGAIELGEKEAIVEQTPRKQTLYRTAYSPMFRCHVALTHAHQDSHGEWIYTATFTDPSDNRTFEGYLFRTEELERFVL